MAVRSYAHLYMYKIYQHLTRLIQTIQKKHGTGGSR
ncbi:hypothetical protein NG2371_05496 [Nocardia gamkensis]|nr:hypothetical protein [Nocardia gamkensis]